MPDTDIRETKLAYHIEIEVPNVTDKRNTLIRCLSDRTLLVEGNVDRPDIAYEPADTDAEWVREGGEDSMGGAKATGSSGDRDGEKETLTYGQSNAISQGDDPTFLLSERKVGQWQRTFMLPLDVDLKALRARLDGGLLSIDLPKKDISGEAGVTIEVQ